MKRLLRKAAASLLAASLMMSQVVTVSATSADVKGDIIRVASKTADDFNTLNGTNILEKAKGEYLPMFDSSTTFNTKYNTYWHDFAAAVGGASKADENQTNLKYMYGGQTYGANAGSQFYCGFGEDVVKVTIGGDEGRLFTYYRSNGTSISHRYKYDKDAIATGNGLSINGFLFKSMDDIPDNYKYLFITRDTPATTYHIEFRYASSEDDVLKLSDGPCKNWLASGISANALSESDDATIKKAIAKVIIDSLSDTSETKKQREDLTGVWDYNFTNAEQGVSSLDNAKKFFKNVKDGSGIEYRDAFGNGNYDEKTSYRFYVYDATPGDATKSGTYLRYIPGKGVVISTYTINSGDGGSLVASFQTVGENDSSYTFRKTLAPGKKTNKKVKAKGKKISVSWKAVANADRYQIVVSTGKSFSKLAAEKTTAKTKISIKVKKKQTYYIKVRGYVTDALGLITCGKYSKVKKIKV